MLSKKKANILPIHHSYDYTIKIKDDYQPFSTVIYKMSKDEI